MTVIWVSIGITAAMVAGVEAVRRVLSRRIARKEADLNLDIEIADLTSRDEEGA